MDVALTVFVCVGVELEESEFESSESDSDEDVSSGESELEVSESCVVVPLVRGFWTVVIRVCSNSSSWSGLSEPSPTMTAVSVKVLGNWNTPEGSCVDPAASSRVSTLP